MFAQLDLWRTAALASSPLSVMPVDHTSPSSLSHEQTMARNISQRNNPSVQTPPPLSALHSPPTLDFEPTNPLGHMNNPGDKGIGSSHLGNQLPEISTLQSPTLKNEKFDIYDVLNMLDTGHSMDSHDKHLEIKREHHCSGPPEYPVFSQAPASSSYEPLTISASSNSPLHGTQSYFSTSQSQQMRPIPPLVYSSTLTQVNPSGNLLITPASFPSSLQIINTSATISSPQQQSTQIKQEQQPILSTHQLSQLLPPPYPGTAASKTVLDQSTTPQTTQQSQKPFTGHQVPEFPKHTQNEDDDEEDMDDAAASASRERNLTSAVTIRPVSVPAAPTQNISGRTTTNIHLWQFIKELLLHPELHSSSIHWVDRETGIFKIVDSVRVATLWGKRKNRPAMNYDKLSRSLRQYYKKGIMKKTERTQRLVYQFCHPYHL